MAQKEKIGPKYGFGVGEQVQRMGMTEIVGTSVLWLDSSRKTTKTPPVGPARFALERNFIFRIVVEESFPPQKVPGIFLQIKRYIVFIIERLCNYDVNASMLCLCEFRSYPITDFGFIRSLISE